MNSNARIEKMKDNEIITGYKGKQILDTGYFYAPYAPVTKAPVIMGAETFVRVDDPWNIPIPIQSTFNPNKGIMTRYGKKMLEEGAKFYDRLSVSNFSD